MNFNNRENKCYSTTDGKDIWNSRSIAVVGMVLMRQDDEIYVLIGKRGEALPNEVGKWCLPCGYLDWDETCEEAVVREIFEETGLNIYKTSNQYEVVFDQMNYPWKINSEPDGDAQTVSLHYAICFDTTISDLGLPELSLDNNKSHPNEVDEVKWIRFSDIHLYDMAFGHDRTIRVFVNNLAPYEKSNLQ